MNKLRKPQSDFTIIPNALLRDERLSLKAKGIFCLLFSKPDDWEYIEEVLVRESSDGRDAFRSGIAELAASGWVRKEQVRVEGSFSHTEIWLNNASVAVVSADGPAVAGKPVATNTDINKTDKTNTPPTPKGAETVEGFSEFWEAYPKKVSKPDALKSWRRLKPDLVAVLAGLRRWKASEQWTKDGGQFIPNPATWINRENWKDPIAGEKRQLTPQEIADAQQRSKEAEEAHRQRMRELTESRRRELGMVT